MSQPIYVLISSLGRTVYTDTRKSMAVDIMKDWNATSKSDGTGVTFRCYEGHIVVDQEIVIPGVTPQPEPPKH